MRKYIYRAVSWTVLLVMLFTTACGKKDGKVEDTASDEVCFSQFFFGGDAALAERYVLYYSDGMYRIFDVKSKSDIPYCFEPNCTHKAPVWDVSGKLLQDGCPAYKFGGSPVLRGDNTIWFTLSELIQGDREGKNRKTIAKLEIPCGIVYDQIYTDKDFFYTYTQSEEYTKEKDKNGNEYWLPGETLEQPECGIYRISLETGEQQYIYRFFGYDSKIRQLFSYGDSIYFTLHYSRKPYINPDWNNPEEDWEAIQEENRKNLVMEVYSYNMNTKELVCLAEERANFKDVFFGNGFFCVYDSDVKSAEWFDLTGTKLRETETRVSGSCYFAMDGVAFYHLRDEKNHYQVFEMYDVVNNKVLRHVERGGSMLGISNVMAIIGTSYYVHVFYPDGTSCEAWISEDDFWNGDWDKSVILKESK